jgi:outer membrane protein
MKSFYLLFLWLFSATAAAEPTEFSVGVLFDGPKEQQAHFVQVLNREFLSISDKAEAVLLFPDEVQLSSNYTTESVQQQLEKLLADSSVDIVVVLGPLGAKTASDIGSGRRGLSKPVFAPFVFDAQLQEIGGKIGENRSNIRNFHFIDTPYVMQNDIEAFQEILDFKHLGIVVDKAVASTIEGSLEELFLSRLRRVKTLDIILVGSSGEDALAQMGSIPENADAIYLTETYQMDGLNRKNFINGLSKLNKPTFSKQGADLVKDGVLASLLRDDIGHKRLEKTAQYIKSYTDGAKVSELPIQIDVAGGITINMDTAKNLGISPPWDVLAEAYVLDSTAKDSQSFSIVSAMEAAASHPSLAGAERSLAASAQNLVTARAGYLPQLEVALGLEAMDGDRAAQTLQYASMDTAFGLQIDQAVWSYGKLAQVKIEQSRQDARALDLEALRRDMASDAARAYLGLLRARAVESTRRIQLQRLRKLHDLSRRRAASDLSSSADVYRMESAVAMARKVLIEAYAHSKRMESLFNQVVGRQPSEPVVLDHPDLLWAGSSSAEARLANYTNDPRSFPTFAKVMYEMGMVQNLELLSLQRQADAKWSEVRVDQAAYWSPEVSVRAGMGLHLMNSGDNPLFAAQNGFNDLLVQLDGAGVGHGIQPLPLSTRDNLDWQAGAYVQFPAFNGFKRQAASARSSAEFSALEEAQKAMAYRQEAELHQILVDMNARYRELEFSKSSMKSANMGMKKTAELYADGSIALNNLQQCYEDVAEAEISTIEGIYSFRRALLSALSVMNLLDFYSSPEVQQRLFSALNTSYKTDGYFTPR